MDNNNFTTDDNKTEEQVDSISIIKEKREKIIGNNSRIQNTNQLQKIRKFTQESHPESESTPQRLPPGATEMIKTPIKFEEIENLIKKEDKNAQEYLDIMKKCELFKLNQDFLVQDLLEEVEKLTNDVQVMEESISDTNVKISGVTESIIKSERVFEEELSYLLDENKGKREGLENYQKLKEMEEKRKVEDLEVSLISSKKSLNAKMIEMQKLTEKMKQEENFDAKLDQEIQDVQDHVKMYNEISSRLQWETNEILMKKKFLNNEIQNFKGNIRVHVRLRDFLLRENRTDYIHIDGYKNLSLKVPQKFLRSANSQNVYNFKFEHIYNKGTSQSHIFDEISPLVQSICDGYNACIFAYGQTGGGKTHTLIGGEDEESKGVLPRSIEIIFERVDFMRKNGWECLVKASFTELYMDCLFDLLDESSNDNRKAVNAMREVEITSKEQLLKYVEVARRNRTTGCTQSNSQSSRSHALFQIKLDARKIKKKAVLVSSGCLNIIDLAGSERLNLSQVQGNMKNETICINKSLMALSKVIISLSKRGTHVPYRNSKLTFLLKDYLGKNSKTMVIVALNPCIESFGLTLGSLKFANNLKRVEFGHTVRKNYRVTAKKFRKESQQTGRRNFSARSNKDDNRSQGNFGNRRFNKHSRSNSRHGYSTRGSPGKNPNRQRRYNHSQSVIQSRQELANRNFQTPKSKKMAVTFVDPSQTLSDHQVLVQSGYREEDIKLMNGTQMSAIVVRERNRMKNLAYKKASNQLKEYAGIPRQNQKVAIPQLQLPHPQVSRPNANQPEVFRPNLPQKPREEAQARMHQPRALPPNIPPKQIQQPQPQVFVHQRPQQQVQEPQMSTVSQIRPSLNLLPSDDKEAKPQVDLLKQSYDKRIQETPVQNKQKLQLEVQTGVQPQVQKIDQLYTTEVKYGTDEKDEQKRVERYTGEGQQPKILPQEEFQTPKFNSNQTQANQFKPESDSNYTPQRQNQYQGSNNHYDRNNSSQNSDQRRYQNQGYSSRNPERNYDNRGYDNRNRGYHNNNSYRGNNRNYNNNRNNYSRGGRGRGGYNNHSRGRGGYNNYSRGGGGYNSNNRRGYNSNNGYNNNYNDRSNSHQKSFHNPQDQYQNRQRRDDSAQQHNAYDNDYSASQNFN